MLHVWHWALPVSGGGGSGRRAPGPEGYDAEPLICGQRGDGPAGGQHQDTFFHPSPPFRRTAPVTTFGYNDKGEMIGLCQAKDMIFITTRGGAYQEAGLSWMEMGARHLEALCSMFHPCRYSQR